MNKNEISKIFLFILLVMLLVGIVSATDNSTSNVNAVSEEESSNIASSNMNSQSSDISSNENIINENNDINDNNGSNITTDTRESSTITVKSTKKVYVDDTVTIYGKLSSDLKNITKTKITVQVGSQTYNLKTTRYGNYNLKINASTLGENIIIASYSGSDYYRPCNASTKFIVNQKTTIITVGSTKSVYVGDSVSIYGKLSSRGIGLPYKNIIITTQNQNFTTTTSKYGNYNIKIRGTLKGNNTLQVFYDGTNIYTNATATTTYNVNQKNTTITVGSTKNVYVGDTLSIYGKLSARGIGLPYKNITITTQKQNFTTTTSKYGNYNIKIRGTLKGNNTLEVFYNGTNIYTNATATTTYNVNQKNTTITVGSTKSTQLGGNFSIYGKISARGIGLPFANITVNVGDNNYNITTSRYGNYNIKVIATTAGNNTITANYNGTKVYTVSNASTFCNVKSSYDISLKTSLVKNYVEIAYDSGNETAITKRISTVNGLPDITKLGSDYQYANETGTYTILGSEIRRVMKLDSQCQELYGFTPKYTFFRAVGSNIKYVISREKWNVIVRELNAYHVKKGYTAVDTPYAITVYLGNHYRYYPVYYDAQEYINGHQYTCGPTAMSMISQALNWYSSERRLASVYSTTASYGTSESSIIYNSPSVQMKLTDIADNKKSVINTLTSGKMVFWHIRGHYMCVIAYNNVSDKFLCLNPSGPSHNISAVMWANWTEMMNTDRGLKENGFMAVTPYWNMNNSQKTLISNYYYNMGRKYVAPANLEYPNVGSSLSNVTVNKTSSIVTTTVKTTLKMNVSLTKSNNKLNGGKVSFYLNGKYIGNSTLKNGLCSLSYVLSDSVGKKNIITAKYTDENSYVISVSSYI